MTEDGEQSTGSTGGGGRPSVPAPWEVREPSTGQYPTVPDPALEDEAEADSGPEWTVKRAYWRFRVDHGRDRPAMVTDAYSGEPFPAREWHVQVVASRDPGGYGSTKEVQYYRFQSVEHYRRWLSDTPAPV